MEGERDEKGRVKFSLQYLPGQIYGRSVAELNNRKLSTGSLHKNVVVSILMWPWKKLIESYG